MLIAYCLAFFTASFIAKLMTETEWLFAAGLFLSACIIQYFCRKKLIKKWLPYLIAFAMGFLWMQWYAKERLSKQWPTAYENQKVRLSVKVMDLIDQRSNRSRFEAKVVAANDPLLSKLIGEKIRLHYYIRNHHNDSPITNCAILDVTIKVKRPRDLFNNLPFSYQQFAFQQELIGQGYIVDLHHLEQSQPCLDNLRQQWRHHLITSMPAQTAKWLLALTIGDRTLLTTKDRQWLVKSGLSHAFVISGLHIGFVAALMYGLVLLIRRMGGVLLMQGDWRQAATAIALLSAGFYAFLAGWTYPTLRALIAVAFFMLMTSSRYRFGLWQRYFACMAVVLTLFPLATLDIGFLLSFFAVFIILLVISQPLTISTGRTVIQFIRFQWAFFILMMPLGWYYFNTISLVSPITNFFTIPILSFYLVPFALMQTVLFLCGLHVDMFHFWLVGSVDLLIEMVVYIMKIWPLPTHMHKGIDVLTAMTLLIGGFLLVMPRVGPVKVQGVVFILGALIMMQMPKKSQPTLALTMMDVGQGLALLIQTSNKTLLYDTGAAWQSGSMASLVVRPTLYQANINTIDKLVVSHGDNDHSGGVDEILAAFKVDRLMVSSQTKSKHLSVDYCEKGRQWLWDEVKFTVLHPEKVITHKAKNNDSCVILIEVAGKRILLTGDIERSIEQQLLQSGLNQIDVLVVAHHGSLTSSSAAFIDVVKPEIALISSGYLNRYRHPHPTVLNRLNTVGANVLTTANHGAIRLTINQQKINLTTSYHKNAFWQ